MKNKFKKRTLGATGLTVCRLGVAASYGAPAESFEEAFENGCNYFYYGSGRHREGMRRAIQNIVASGQREKLVICLQTYARFGLATEYLFRKTLDAMNLDYADIMILGWHNSRPANGLLERALAFKEKGLVKFIGMSGHNRSLFPELAQDDLFDVFHIRYNAAHRGAEKESFPHFKENGSQGIVTYTATRWGHLLNPKKMPKGELPLSASDCYRFSMSNPAVDVCLAGPKNIDQMRTALSALQLGELSDEEMQRVRMIGDYIYRTSKGFF